MITHMVLKCHVGASQHVLICPGHTEDVAGNDHERRRAHGS